MADSGGAPIDRLSIEIGASADAAVKKINDVANALKNLKAAQSSSGKKSTLLSQMKSMSSDSVSAMSKIDLLRMKLAALRQELGKKMAFGELDAKGIANAAIQIKNLESQIEKVTKDAAKKAKESTQKTTGGGVLSTALGKIASTKPVAELLGKLKSVQKVAEKIAPAIKLISSALKQAAKHAMDLAKNVMRIAGRSLKTLWDNSAVKKLEQSANKAKQALSTFGRIAFYRAVRSAIKYITDALKEGVDNAYWYAREFGNATRYIADAYDQMSGANFKMSNQLGAAWATLIATIQPIIQKIIELVTRAANILTQFFALLGGKSTYLKAIDYNKKWADSASGAAKAAEEWKNQLMGFDEINRLEEPSDGGGGGGGNLPDYGNMFEEAPLDSPLFDQIKDMINSGKWEELGQMLGEKVNTLVDSIDFKAIGKFIGEKINNAIRLSYSFLNTVDFQNIGKKIADLLNNAMAGIDFNKLGRLRVRIKTALWDVIYGAVISVDWARVAVSISDYLIGAMNELAGWISGLDAGEIAKAFDDFFGNVKWDEIADAAVGLLKTAFQKLTEILTEADVSSALSNVGGLIKTVISDGIMNTDFAELHNVLSYKIDAAVFGDKWANFWWGHGDYAGKEIISGLIEGTKTKQKDLEAQMEDVSQSTVDVTERMLDIHSPSKVFYNIGVNIIQGLLNGISQTWSKFTSSFQGLWNGLQKWWSSLTLSPIHIPHPHFEWTYKEATGLIAKAMEWAGLNPQIPELNISWYAKGGFPEDGLFMANHGELVGEFSNGRTAVANNEQITEGISHAVYDAFMTAFSQTSGNGGDDREVRIYLDGREIAKSTTKYQRQMARAGGV